jgi:hypothetical protein
MNTLVQNTAKLAISAVLAVLVTGVVGFAINTSSSIPAPRADHAQEAQLAQPGPAAAHHYG